MSVYIIIVNCVSAKVIKSTDDNRDDNSWSISSEVDGSKKASGFRAQGKLYLKKKNMFSK